MAELWYSRAPSGASMLYDAANKLYKAMWRQDLGSRLQDVDQCDGLKYLPATVVSDLQLQILGCKAETILVREEYLFALDALEGSQKMPGGIVVTGHPGIGKSIFIFYVLLHLLSKGQPVALQYDTVFFIFRQDGVEMHEADSRGLFFHSEERTWALTSSYPCNAFLGASRMGRAWIVLAASPPTDDYDRFRHKYYAGLFVMDCITREESRALGIVYGLDAERIVGYFEKWGPSACTCLRLACGTMSEGELEYNAVMVAWKFVEDPSATAMEANSEVDYHLLFVTLPDNPKRNLSTLRVATPYLHGFVMRAIASINAAKQVSFYAKASSRPSFRDAFGYVFEKVFYVWFSSNPYNELLCTAWPRSAESTRSTGTAHKQVERLRLRPVGWEKVIVYRGESDERGYKTANRHQTPFGWVPASQSDATFDAIVCTDTNIITIQVTGAAAKHSMKAECFENLVKYLPKRFREDRSWCHVFVTNSHDTAAKLGDNYIRSPIK